MSEPLLRNAPLPLGDPIARPRRRNEFSRGQKDPLEGLLGDSWANYLGLMAQNVSQANTRLSSASLVDQEASISPTDLSGGALRAGFYRVHYYMRVTRAATIGSSLTFTLSWDDLGVTQTESGAAETGNTTTTNQTGTFTFYSDATSPITFATTYASGGITTMQYRLAVFLEAIQA